MPNNTGWLIFFALLLAFRVWRLSALAGRIDRLHHRIELATGSLDNQLLRRSRAAEAIAASGLVDPASSIVLAQAASNARNADASDLIERWLVESEMSRVLRELFSEPAEVAGLAANPEGRELLEDLAVAGSGVAMSRRFLNDGVQATRLLRAGRLVRWFRLAGHAPMPRTVELDDEVAAALLALA
jgi:hypothetical protein